jgi:hypothetical protein
MDQFQATVLFRSTPFRFATAGAWNGDPSIVVDDNKTMVL